MALLFSILAVASGDFQLCVPLGPESSHLPFHVSAYCRQVLRNSCSRSFLVKLQATSEAAFTCREQRLQAPVKNRPEKRPAFYATLNLPDFTAGPVTPFRAFVRICNLHLDQRGTAIGRITSLPSFREHCIPGPQMLCSPFVCNQRKPESVILLDELPCLRRGLNFSANCRKPLTCLDIVGCCCT